MLGIPHIAALSPPPPSALCQQFAAQVTSIFFATVIDLVCHIAVAAAGTSNVGGQHSIKCCCAVVSIKLVICSLQHK